MSYIYSDFIPKDVSFFTPGKRYEIIDKFNDYKKGTEYQVTVIGDDGKKHGPINVGWPCAYLEEISDEFEATRQWNVEETENVDKTS